MNIIKKYFAKLRGKSSPEMLDIQMRTLFLRGCSKTISLNEKWGIFDYDFSNIFTNYNIGDGIQSLAVKNFKKIYFPETSEIILDRENISTYEGDPILLIMQGYFTHTKYFLPRAPITPIWVGTHFNLFAKTFLKEFVQNYPDYFNGVNVGCRDISTRDFLESIGVKSYLSRCLTLTFPLRKKQMDERVFIVDVPSKLHKYIPEKIRRNAIINKQRAVPYKTYSSFEKRLEISQQTLDLYRDNASLVITTALHCASPCLAMGIPVIFIDVGKESARFSSLDNIIPIYSKEDLENKRIDFNNVPIPNIENLKELIFSNLSLTILQGMGQLSENGKKDLDEIRNKIKDFNAM